MKNSFKSLLSFLLITLLVSCSSDSINQTPVITPGPPQGTPPVTDPDENSGEDDDSYTNVYFGFLNGEGSSQTYLEMPIDSSATNLIVGRWKIKNFRYEVSDINGSYDYKDYTHKDCGQSFLQFNTDGIVFENVYFKEGETCSLTVEIANWALIDENRLKIGDNIIYIEKVTQTELILKFDGDDTGWGPLLLYYQYERIRSPN